MRHWLFPLLLLLAGHAHGNTYYVSDCAAGAAAQCVSGNDANNGTSAATPWRSCTKVTQRFPTLAAGDEVLFARGAAVAACQLYYLSNPNSRKHAPITLGAYTPPWAIGVPDAPILLGPTGTYTLALLNSGNSTHDEGYRIQDLHFVGPGPNSQLPAIAIGNDVDNVTIERVEIEEHLGGIQCDGGTNNGQGADSDGLSEHIVIRDSSIHHNRGIGILVSCNDTLIENNRFDSNGVGMLDHHIYVDDAALNNVALTTSQVIIRGNQLTNNSPYASASAPRPTTGGCGATAIVVHGLKDGVVIENNVVSEPTVPRSGSCWGISVDSGGYTGIYAREGFRNVSIRGNTVINFSLGIGVDLCSNCTVENNSIYSEFAGGAAGVVAPAKYFESAVPGNTLNSGLTVRNNSVYLRNPGPSSVGIRLSRDGAGHVVVSNLVYFGTSSTASTACFLTAGLTASAFKAFDNNLCYFSGTPGLWDGTRTLAAQQAAGLDLRSLNANPGLAPPLAPQFALTPGAGSPALSAGHPTLSSKFGKGGVRRDNRPDIGASQPDATVVVPSSPTGLTIQ